MRWGSENVILPCQSPEALHSGTFMLFSKSFESHMRDLSGGKEIVSHGLHKIPERARLQFLSKRFFLFIFNDAIVFEVYCARTPRSTFRCSGTI